MKKTGKIIIALFAVAVMLLSMAACGGNAGKTDGNLMQGIFDKLTASADYNEWKSGFNTTTFEEKLDGNSIVISAKGEEGMNGDYTFTLDGDYIVNTTDEGDYSAYSLMMYLKSAVADYYGMNNMLMTGYLAGLGADAENKYYFTETADGKTTTKLYAAGEWEMEDLDKMYVDDAAAEYIDPLGENPNSSYVNSGKITAAALGSADELDLMVGEYGDENTELTYKSILTLVNKLQPNGYENFVEAFTEIKEGSGEGYTVSFGIPQEVADRHEYKAADGYSYVTVTFSADAAPAADDEDGQNPVMNFVGPYQADRCTITIGADGMEGATVSVIWGQSASEAYEYTMTGDFDPDTLRIHYSDCEKKYVKYDENGDIAEETVEFTDGDGRIQFFGDGTLRWEDENEADRLEGMTFTFNA